MSNTIPEIAELEALLISATKTLETIKSKYVREDRKIINVPGFGWCVTFGDHIYKATPADVEKAKKAGEQ